MRIVTREKSMDQLDQLLLLWLPADAACMERKESILVENIGDENSQTCACRHAVLVLARAAKKSSQFALNAQRSGYSILIVSRAQKPGNQSTAASECHPPKEGNLSAYQSP